MKPTKNRMFCYDCGRQKMLFETEKKADTFIKFNSEEIELETGYAPERSYFCIACNGWHVTSKQEALNIKSKTEKLLEKLDEERKLKKERQQQKKLQETQKKEELKSIIELIENNINIIENSFDDRNLCIDLINKTSIKLEKAKNIRLNFKGSNKRKKEAEIRLIYLKEKLNY